MSKLYLVDVSSMIFRAFYAIRSLSSPTGQPVNALYGLVSMSVKLLREIRPDYLAYCFDRPEPSFRKAIDPRYKANRSEMPAELVPQMPYVRRLCSALGIPCYDFAEFEADDIIGTLTRRGREWGLQVVIVSGDKDFAQLVDESVSMYDSMKEVFYDPMGVVEKWGVEPQKIVDYLSLVGDSSDNIPGVSGIGAKGAQKLLSQFESLDDIYDRLKEITSASVVKKLEAGKEEAMLAKELVTIRCDVPLNASLSDLKPRPTERETLKSLLGELGFKTFLRSLLGEGGATVQDESSSGEKMTGGSPEIAASVIGSPNHEASTMAVKTMDLPELHKWLQPGELTWVLSTDRVRIFSQGKVIVETQAEGPELGQLLNSKDLVYKGFDIKTFCRQHHVRRPRVSWDQMLAAYVIRPGPIDHPASLFSTYLGQPLPELPSSRQLFAAHGMLEEELRQKLKSVAGERLLYEIEQPLVAVLLEMELAGIRIDTSVLERQSFVLQSDLESLEKEVHAETGEVFNIGSPKQLSEILFGKMNIPTGKKTKTGYSTDNEVLESRVKDYPIVAKILTWRELSKLKSTYVDALPQMVDSETGRIHTTFNQAWTVTGRLSSVNPNLQNIPIRTKRGSQIRSAFVAPRGHQLISADYSQIELRILAHITGDLGLKRAFDEGSDVHLITASEIFEVPVDDVTPEMRRRAKAVNFGLAYGQSAFGLAESLRVSRREATDIINRYFARFQGVKDYMVETVEVAKKKGFVETIYGRRRYLDEFQSSRSTVRKFAERAAINAPIQGTASDLVKMAMIRVVQNNPAALLLQVHDELVFEAKSEEVSDVIEKIRAPMEEIAQLSVPLKINIGTGVNWEEAHQ